MTLMVNGEELDITLENEKTVGDVLKSFELEAEKAEAATIKICLNKKEITSEDFDSILEQPIEEDTLIELSVITKTEVIACLTDSSQKFISLAKELEEIPVMLQGGKDTEANSVITKLAKEIDIFCHTAALSALFQDVYSKLTIEGKDIGTFFSEFSPVLADFEEALKSKDTVTIGDLSEYEISPRLTSLSEAINSITQGK